MKLELHIDGHLNAFWDKVTIIPRKGDYIDFKGKAIKIKGVHFDYEKKVITVVGKS